MINNLVERHQAKTMIISSLFFFVGRGLNIGPYIFYALPISTQLSSQEQNHDNI